MSTEHSQCGICKNQVNFFGKLNSCEHNFHFKCIKKWSKTSNRCPTCKLVFSEIAYSSDKKIIDKIDVSEPINKDSRKYNDFIEKCFVCGNKSLNFIVECEGVGCENFAHEYCIPYRKIDYWLCGECKSYYEFCEVCNKIVKDRGKSCDDSWESCEAVAHLDCLKPWDYDFWLCKFCYSLNDNLIGEEKNAKCLNENKYCDVCGIIINNCGKFCFNYDCLNKSHLRCLRGDEKTYWECHDCLLASIEISESIDSSETVSHKEVPSCENTDHFSKKFDFVVESKEVNSEFGGVEILSDQNFVTLDERNKARTISFNSKNDFLYDKSGSQLSSQSLQYPLDCLKDRDCSLCENLTSSCELPIKRQTCDKEKGSILETVKKWVRKELKNHGKHNIEVEQVFRSVVKDFEQKGGDLENRGMICNAVKDFIVS